MGKITIKVLSRYVVCCIFILHSVQCLANEKEGALVIPFIYNDTFSFNDGIALVTKDGITGLTDVYGNSCFFN